MWAELVHCHFLYVPAVLNVVNSAVDRRLDAKLKPKRTVPFKNIFSARAARALKIFLNGTVRLGTGTKNIFKWNRALGFEFSIQSSVYGAITVAKVSLFSTWTRYTVSFYSM